MIMNEKLAQEFREQILTEYAGQFRGVWVQFSNIGKSRSKLCITLFPIRGPYRMVFTEELDSINWTDVQKLVDSFVNVN